MSIRTYFRTVFVALILCVVQVALAQEDAASILPDKPYLAEFRVTGTLSTNVVRNLPFRPHFKATAAGMHFNHHCYLDYEMETFTLHVDSQFPAILSSITRDGVAVPSRDNLTDVHLTDGEKAIFEVLVTDRTSRAYTLIVERRRGKSLELLGFTPLTAELREPFHAGELQERFDVTQSFYEDFFEVETIKADGGQQITCAVTADETTSDNKPSRAELYHHPNWYVPAIEREKPNIEESYDNSKGNVVKCRLPIDTWRKLTVTFTIRSANKQFHRDLRLIVDRKGCATNTFFHEGRCLDFCPTGFYKQRFNWRCGTCKENCEFCTNWNSCNRCRGDTTLIKYQLQEDGSCTAVRIHKYRIYYDLFRYFAVACAALLTLYLLLCVIWASRRLCCDFGSSSGRGSRGSRGSRGMTRGMNVSGSGSKSSQYDYRQSQDQRRGYTTYDSDEGEDVE